MNEKTFKKGKKTLPNERWKESLYLYSDGGKTDETPPYHLQGKKKIMGKKKKKRGKDEISQPPFLYREGESETNLPQKEKKNKEGIVLSTRSRREGG